MSNQEKNKATSELKLSIGSWPQFYHKFKIEGGAFPLACQEVIDGEEKVFSHLPGGLQETPRYHRPLDIERRMMPDDPAIQKLGYHDDTAERKDNHDTWNREYQRQHSDWKERIKQR